MIRYNIIKNCGYCRTRFVVSNGNGGAKRIYCDKCEKIKNK